LSLLLQISGPSRKLVHDRSGLESLRLAGLVRGHSDTDPLFCFCELHQSRVVSFRSAKDGNEKNYRKSEFPKSSGL
jgi:hypothetical protein